MSYRTIPFSVDEYADIIGVNKGFDDWDAKFRTPSRDDAQAVREFNCHCEKFNEWYPMLHSQAVLQEEFDAFHRELCARYLPIAIRIFRTWIRGSQVSAQTNSLFQTSFGEILGRAAQGHDSSLARYIREHPDSKGFMSDLLDSMPKFLPTPDDLKAVWTMDPVNPAYNALSVVSTAAVIVQQQLILCPDASIILRTPRLPLTFQLDTLTKYFRGHQRDNAFEEDRRKETAGMLNQVLGALKHQSVDKIRSWVDRTPEAQVKFLVGCVALEEGNCVQREELMMCGKCKAVRYCSRAHQKKHWKAHKPMCFEPSW